MFAYPVMAAHVGDAAGSGKYEEITALLVSIVKYIVENGFTLVDVTGEPTTWGMTSL